MRGLLTPKQNALRQDWAKFDIVFCNPPFHRDRLEQWVVKGFLEAQKGATVVMVLPYYKSYAWFRYVVVPFAEIRQIQGNVIYSGYGNKKESVLEIRGTTNTIRAGHLLIPSSPSSAKTNKASTDSMWISPGRCGPIRPNVFHANTGKLCRCCVALLPMRCVTAAAVICLWMSMWRLADVRATPMLPHVEDN